MFSPDRNKAGLPAAIAEAGRAQALATYAVARAITDRLLGKTQTDTGEKS
jgi:hypothetical protein